MISASANVQVKIVAQTIFRMLTASMDVLVLNLLVLYTWSSVGVAFFLEFTLCGHLMQIPVAVERQGELGDDRHALLV